MEIEQCQYFLRFQEKTHTHTNHIKCANDVVLIGRLSNITF